MLFGNAFPESKTYSTFGGSDIVATLSIPDVAQYTIGELEAVSYSVHRNPQPVRVTGRVDPAGFVLGGRMIAGTLVFLTIDRHLIHRFREDLKEWWVGAWENAKRPAPPFPSRFMADTMPPFKIDITAANEYGLTSQVTIKGVRLVSDGQVMRVDQISSDMSCQYVAQDIVVWDHAKTSRSSTV